jgi:hypothetical protein
MEDDKWHRGCVEPIPASSFAFERIVMKSHHILNAASNLLGVSLIIVTALHITSYSKQTFADEIGLAAALLLICSCLFSYWAIRTELQRFENGADRLFLVAQVLLLAAVIALWF